MILIPFQNDVYNHQLLETGIHGFKANISGVVILPRQQHL